MSCLPTHALPDRTIIRNDSFTVKGHGKDLAPVFKDGNYVTLLGQMVCNTISTIKFLKTKFT